MQKAQDAMKDTCRRTSLSSFAVALPDYERQDSP